MSLAERLQQDERVVRIQKTIDENSEGHGARRQLLATSLRLTEGMSPRLHSMRRACAERLELTIPTEIYVYNSADLNAACIKPENGRLLLLFSSAILEKFDETELRFVMGHELGHHLFGHHDIPIQRLTSEEEVKSAGTDARLALQLFAWSRYAEISADRAGALCADDADGSARALFKLASGLTTDLIEIRIDEFAAQVDEMELEDNSAGPEEFEADWFMTHPFTPLRVKALQKFFQSEFFVPDGASRSQLEAECEQLMQVMSPTYLEENSEAAEMMRRVVFAAGCVLMDVSGGINEREIAAFNSLFGQGAFSDKLNIETLEQRLDRRIADAVAHVSPARRVQIVRDLCMIAAADGRVTSREREFLIDVGQRLQIAPEMTAEILKERPQLD